MCSPVGAGPHNEAMKGLFHLGLGLQSFSSVLFHGTLVTAGGNCFSYLQPDAEAQSGYRCGRCVEAHLQICSAHMCVHAHAQLLVRSSGWPKSEILLNLIATVSARYEEG